MGGDGVWWGGEECMWVLPGLLMLDLGLGEGVDGNGEGVIGVVSGCEMGKKFVFLFRVCVYLRGFVSSY